MKNELLSYNEARKILHPLNLRIKGSREYHKKYHDHIPKNISKSPHIIKTKVGFR